MIEVYFVLYLQYLGDTMHSKSAVETAVNAIAWAHELASYSSISNIPIVTAGFAAFTGQAFQ